jgi:uncharacterized protein
MARLLTLAGVLLAASVAAAQPLPPELTAPVNDFANVIDPGTEADLATLIRSLEAASGDVIVVATVRTFRPYADLPSYAVKMFENHGRGIGARGTDGGALIVLAVDDRQVRIEVGYGLEGFVTDGFAGETSRDVMVPFFRRGEYGEGLLAGATRVAQRIAEGRNVTLDVRELPARRPPRSVGIGINPLTLLIVLYILYRVLRGGGPRGGLRGRRGRRWSSGVGPFGVGAGWGAGSSWGGSSGGFSGGFGGGFGGFGGGRSGGGGGGASW